MEFKKKEALKYLKTISNVTDATKAYCEAIGIEYEVRYMHKLRRHAIKSNSEYNGYNEKRVSKSTDIIEPGTETKTNQYSNGINRLSALKVDGTIMDITEYCRTYGIPEEHVKSYKLVTHTGKGAYYNIASNVMKGDKFDEFYKSLLEDLANTSNKPYTLVREKNKEESFLLVVDPADIHIGKLCDSFETGENYDSQIAVKRVKEGVQGILDKVSGFKIDKILFVGGNDILHIDTPKRTTTSGTPQDTDGMWYSNFLVAKQLYVDILNKLLDVADIHFVYNPSNHDYMSGFFLADVIKTYFKDCENITFDTTIAHRKYFRYHDNLIGTNHGDGAKEADLGPLMAHEAKDWSNCKHRYIYTHHVHHKTAKDKIGVTLESLRSPSGTDGWHSRNGYTGVPKAVEGFLHSKTQGQVARITHIF